MYVCIYMYIYMYIYIYIIYIYIYSITVGAISAGKPYHALDCIDFITETVDLVINRAF